MCIESRSHHGAVRLPTFMNRRCNPPQGRRKCCFVLHSYIYTWAILPFRLSLSVCACGSWLFPHLWKIRGVHHPFCVPRTGSPRHTAARTFFPVVLVFAPRAFGASLSDIPRKRGHPTPQPHEMALNPFLLVRSYPCSNHEPPQVPPPVQPPRHAHPGLARGRGA